MNQTPTEPTPENASPAEWSNKRILTLLALGTAIVSAIWHLPQEASYISHRTGEFFFTIVLATALTYVLRPAVNRLERTRIFSRLRGSRTWAATVVFVVAVTLFAVFLTLSLRPVIDDGKALRDYFLAMNDVDRHALIDSWQSRLDVALKPYLDFFAPGTNLQIDRDVPRFIVNIVPGLKRWAGDVFSHLGFIVELLLVPVLVFYFLADGRGIREEARLLVSEKFRPRGARLLSHLDRVLDGYIRGQMCMCVIAWIAVSLGLWALRVPHAFTLGLLAGLTRAVPVIGPLLGGVPIVLVCLLTTRSVPLTLTVLTGFIVMHFVESKVLLPKIIGHEVDLHPVSVIVVLILGLEFFGFLGVFLAVPLAAVIKVLLVEWHESRAAKPVLVETSSTR